MKWLFIILLLISCSHEREVQVEWTTMQIVSIAPAWKGSDKMCITWKDGRGVDHYEYGDTIHLNYYIGLIRPSLIKR